MLQLSELQVRKVEKFAIIVVTESTVPALIVNELGEMNPWKR